MVLLENLGIIISQIIGGVTTKNGYQRKSILQVKKYELGDGKMNKKLKDSKNTNKALSKKVAPFVMSTSMMAATFLAAGAPISAAELEEKGVKPEIVEQVKNHGQEVSALANSLPGSPEKGKLVSELAKDKSFKTDQLDTTNDDSEDNIDETNNEEPATEEGESK